MTDTLKTILGTDQSPYATPATPGPVDAQQTADAERDKEIENATYSNWQFLKDVASSEWALSKTIFSGDDTAPIDLLWEMTDAHKKRIEQELPKYLWEQLDPASLTSEKGFEKEVQRLKELDETTNRLDNAGTMAQWTRVGVGMLDPAEIAASLGAEALTLGTASPMLAARWGWKLRRMNTLLGGVSNAAVGTALTANRDTGDNITAKDYAFGFGADFLLGSVAGRFSPEWGKIGMDNMRLPPKTEEQLLREVDDLEKGSLSAAAAPTNTVRPGTTLTPELNGDVPIGAKPAGAPRFSVVGQMATSDDELERLLGPRLGEDAVGSADGSKTEVSATEWARQNHTSVEAQWKQALLPSWDQWSKDNGLSFYRRKFPAQKDWEKFSKQVYDFVEDVRPNAKDFYHPSVVQSGERARSLLREFAGDMHNPGRREGIQMRPIAGAENLVPDDYYMPKIADRENIDRAWAEFGRDGLLRVVKNAMRDYMVQTGWVIKEELLDKVSEGWLTNISKAGYGQGDQLMDALAGRSKSTLIGALKNAGLDDSVIDELTQVMGVKDGSTPRTKRRSPINYRKATPLVSKTTGKTVNVSPLFFFSNDVDHIMMSYSRRASGEIALGRLRIKDPTSPDLWIDGITSRSEWESKVLRGLEDSYYRRLGNRDDAKLAVKRAEYLYRAIVGLPQHDVDPRLARAMRRLRDYNFLRLMNNMGITQAIELGRVFSQTGLRAALSQMPSLKRIIMQGTGDRVLNNKMARELEMWGVTENDYWLGASKYRFQEELIGEGGGKPSRWQKLGQQYDDLVQKGKEVLATTSFQKPIHSRLQQWAARASVQWFADNARDAKKFAKFKNRIADMGLDEADMDAIRKQIELHAEASDPEMRKITAMNFDKWDPEVRSKFLSSVRRYTNRIVQVNDPGNLPMFMAHPVAQTLLQFRTFSLASYEKSTLYHLKHRDQQALMVALGDIAFGAGTYALVTYAKAATREDRDEYLKENLDFTTPEGLGKIALQGFARAGIASIIPMVTDTLLSATPVGGVFTNARASGTSSDALGGSAPVDLFNGAFGSIRAITESLWDGRDLSQQELRGMQRITPFGNHMGFVSLLNSMITDRDLMAPRRER